jgi:DNA-binding NarL/FixJ family response regulator
MFIRGGPSLDTQGRVLVIDGKPSVGAALRLLLAPECEVIVETHAIDALGRLDRGEPFDLILCDVRLPGVLGTDFYHCVRRFVPDYAARIVFMTDARPEEVAVLFKNVTALCLFKPFDPDALWSLIRTRTARGARPMLDTTMPASRVAACAPGHCD